MVVGLLQKVNHVTRAYISNANGLPGFLVKGKLDEIVQKAIASGMFLKVAN